MYYVGAETLTLSSSFAGGVEVEQVSRCRNRKSKIAFLKYKYKYTKPNSAVCMTPMAPIFLKI